MKLLRTLGGEAVRLLNVGSAFGDTIHGASTIKGLVSRYNFSTGPTSSSEINMREGISLKNGLYNNSLVIDELVIYNDGLRVQIKESTSLCDDLIDDILRNGDELALVFGEQQNTRSYFSALSVELEGSSKPNVLWTLSDKINALLVNYGALKEGFQPFGIHLWANQHNPKGPTFFKIERAVDLPDNQNAFFSSAPLQTDDHLDILREFEKLVS